LMACAAANHASTAPAASTAAAPAATSLPAKDAAAVFLVTLADPAGATPGARDATAAIAARIAACWRGPAAAGAPAVQLRLALNQDGSIDTVEVADHARFAADTGYRRAALAATRAFLQCAPFSLPAASYPEWSSLSLSVTVHPA